jgi:hypothetical protein
MASVSVKALTQDMLSVCSPAALRELKNVRQSEPGMYTNLWVHDNAVVTQSESIERTDAPIKTVKVYQPRIG